MRLRMLTLMLDVDVDRMSMLVDKNVWWRKLGFKNCCEVSRSNSARTVLVDHVIKLQPALK
jgi:hypothetical protein